MTRPYPWIAIIAMAAHLITGESAATAQEQAEDTAKRLSARQQGASPGGSAAASDSPCEHKPWYCGVSEEQRDRATELFQEGNELFDDSLFLPASKKYREALEHWEHPSIHYNLTLALVGLDRPIEAYQSVQGALQYGDGGLRPAEYYRARDYQKLLRGRITEIEIACDEPGATVSLDGKVLFEGPGRARRLVEPGQHEVVAKKDDYLTTHAPLILKAQKSTRLELDMLHKDRAVLVERRWAPWKPWAVVGAGVGLGLVGNMFQWRSSENNKRFTTLFDQECPAPEGCYSSDLSSGLRSSESRYTWYRRFAYGSYVVGGAAVITGLTLVYFNLPTRRDNPRRNDLVHISVTPTLGPSMRGVAMDVSF